MVKATAFNRTAALIRKNLTKSNHRRKPELMPFIILAPHGLRLRVNRRQPIQLHLQPLSLLCDGDTGLVSAESRHARVLGDPPKMRAAYLSLINCCLLLCLRATVLRCQEMQERKIKQLHSCCLFPRAAKGRRESSVFLDKEAWLVFQDLL